MDDAHDREKMLRLTIEFGDAARSVDSDAVGCFLEGSHSADQKVAVFVVVFLLGLRLEDHTLVVEGHLDDTGRIPVVSIAKESRALGLSHEDFGLAD